MVCLRNICVNTLHKGDSIFTNNNNNNNNNNKCRYRDTTNMEPEMYNYTSYNWSHRNSNEKLKEKSGSYTRKTLDRFTTRQLYLEHHT
jgi:hypothetical protein